ncbi:MAG: mobA 1 [Firmicutes bacterium]|nr:mobA 1 [Bacillota bacterium]
MHCAKIVGLIVAAGYSSRMGRFKPLLPLGTKTVIETAVDSLLHGGITDIRVIVGYQAAELYPVLERLPVSIIENPNYAAGMFSSVLAGLTTFAAEADAFLLLPGDNPLIRKRTIKDLLRCYRQTKAAVSYPVFNGERGHPPLIGAACFGDILASDGSCGLCHILEKFEQDSKDVAVADQGTLLDMDTQEDYTRLTAFYANHHIPTYEECLALLYKHQVSENILRHGQAVARIGRRLAEQLNSVGLHINVEQVIAGCLLHDLAKGKSNHPKRGERLVRRRGFSSLATIVASHMDLQLTSGQLLNEAAVVFLADKLVQGDKPVLLSERFRFSLEKFDGQPDIQAAVLRRQQTAVSIMNNITGLLGTNDLKELVLQ